LIAALEPDALVNAALVMPDLTSADLMTRARSQGVELCEKLLRVAANQSAPSVLRERALWLLKEAVDASASHKLVDIINQEPPDSPVALGALDTLERLAFASHVSEQDLRRVKPERFDISNSTSLGKWLRIVGTFSGAWARDELVRWAHSHDLQTRRSALAELVSSGDTNLIEAGQEVMIELHVPHDDPLWRVLYGAEAYRSMRDKVQVGRELAVNLVDTLRLADLCSLAEQALLSESALVALHGYRWPGNLNKTERRLLDRLRKLLQRST
jgi:hypothetical protein